MVSRAPGAPQTPEIDHFRPAQNSCIKNPGVPSYTHGMQGGARLFTRKKSDRAAKGCPRLEAKTLRITDTDNRDCAKNDELHLLGCRNPKPPQFMGRILQRGSRRIASAHPLALGMNPTGSFLVCPAGLAGTVIKGSTPGLSRSKGGTFNRV